VSDAKPNAGLSLTTRPQKLPTRTRACGFWVSPFAHGGRSLIIDTTQVPGLSDLMEHNPAGDILPGDCLLVVVSPELLARLQASTVEAEQMQRASGRPLSFSAVSGKCTYLNEHGRCDVYAVRPLVCRIFGASEKLPCVWGCKPLDKPFNEREEGVLFLKVLQLGGGQPMVSLPDDMAVFDQLHPKEAQLRGRTLQYGPYQNKLVKP
jgi:hypothetical protein